MYCIVVYYDGTMNIYAKEQEKHNHQIGARCFTVNDNAEYPIHYISEAAGLGWNVKDHYALNRAFTQVW